MDRATRCELLNQFSDDQLRALLEPIQDIEASIVSEPTTGMLMVQVREDALGDTFHLGEILVTECMMRVDSSEGWAMLMGNRKAGAKLAASIDAILAANPDRAPLLDPTIEQFADELAKAEQERYAKLAPTRVHFETQ